MIVDPATGFIYVAGQQEQNDGAISLDSVTRLNPDGSVDRAFSRDGDGDITGAIGSRSSGLRLLLQPDGRLLMGGGKENTNAHLVRYRAGAAYGGTPHAAGTRLQAEDYDVSGEGHAYHDLDAVNHGGQYRTDGVDIGYGGTGFVVGYTGAGEWLKYTVMAGRTGPYTLDLSVANPAAGGVIDVVVDGKVVASVNVPNTGGWGTFQTVSSPAFDLDAGVHDLRLNLRQPAANGAVGNVDWMQLNPQAQPPTAPAFLQLVEATQRTVTFDFDARDATVDHYLIYRNGQALARVDRDAADADPDGRQT